MGTRTTKTKQPKESPKRHSERGHALLSPSGASRWINCTPSARLEEAYGVRETSTYAQEGTLAHEFGELCIRRDLLCNITDAEFDAGLEKIMADELFDSEILDMVPKYVNYITEEARAAKEAQGSVVVEIEQKLDLSEYIPESFGMADCTIISDKVMEVIDLKYGKGVPVYAPNNKQLMLYGLGCLRKFDMAYDIETVRLTIVQPRLDNISSWEISVEDLLKWAVEELKPAAQAAFNGEGELKPGDWCKFCSVKAKCTALAQIQVEMAKHDFADPELLSDEEIADILTKIDALVDWATSVKAYALKQAVEGGKTWPGYKLVESNTKRKWLDEKTAAQAILDGFPEASEDQIYNDPKLKSITDIEKTFGKKKVAEVLKDVIIKPHGEPTLVTLDDKRPALGIEEAVNDFQKES